MRFFDIDLRAISQEILKISIFDMSLKTQYYNASVWGQSVYDKIMITHFNETHTPQGGRAIKLIGLCVIKFMMTSSNGNIYRVTGHLCGEFTGPGDFPAQRSVTQSFDVSFDLRLNERLSEQPWGWWFQTPSWSLWRHCNVCLQFHSLQYAISAQNRVHFSWITPWGRTVKHICVSKPTIGSKLLY